MLSRSSRAAILSLLLSLLQAAPLHAQEARPYEDHQIIRVEVKNQAQLDALEGAGATILNCTPGIGPLDVLVSPDQHEAVLRITRTSRVLQDDVQGMVDRERDPLATAGADPFDDFFLSYHPYDGVGGIVWYMNEIVTRYPTLASMVNIGTTVEGRTIWGIRITSGASAVKPGAVFFGCEHAREWVACTVPAYLAHHLVVNYGVDPDITDLVNNVEFFLIPVFNVDGYVYTWTTSRFWRKNRRNNGGGSFGVDLNRNWGVGWGGVGAGASPSDETYRGPSAFSEPETQALRDFFIAHPNVRVQLDVHSYLQLVMWPFGHTSTLCPDHTLYNEIGSTMQSLIYGVHGKNYNIGPLYTAIYPASGISIDWTYIQRGIVSYTYEARDTGFYGFALPQNQIIPNNEELLPATLFLTNSDWVRSPLRFEFPDGVPDIVTAGLDTTIDLRIISQTESVEPGTASLHYRYDPAGPFSVAPLTPLGGQNYQAVLPATNCSSMPEFYFSVQGNLGTPMSNPRQSPAPQYYSALVESWTHTTPCTGLPGDYDGNERLDQIDFNQFQSCIAGPESSIGPGCAVFDFNGDGDVDLLDIGEFQIAFTGP